MKILQVALLGLVMSIAYAQDPQQPNGSQSKGETRSGSMMSSCQDMMKQHQTMMSEMQKMNDQLQAKVSAMNRATGDQKVQAIADAVNELASQRQEMFAHMQEMHSGKMAHMTGHMQSGDKQSMANCPMMREGMGMMGKPAGSTEKKPANSGQTGQKEKDHQKHHPGE